MRHIREIDPQHTVIMVQVENETGSYGIAARFLAGGASACSHGPIPAELARKTGKTGSLDPGVRLEGRPGVQRLVHRALRRRGRRRRPGRARPADVRQCVAQRSVQGRRRAIWRERRSQLERDRHLEGGRAAHRARGARHLRPRSEKVYAKQLDHYARPDNPLFVPETGNAAEYSRFFWLALGKGAIGLAPFGMDATGYSNFPLGAQKLDARNARRLRVQIRAARADRARLGAAGVRAPTIGFAKPDDGADQTQSWAAGRSPRNTANGSSANANGRGSTTPPNPNKDAPSAAQRSSSSARTSSSSPAPTSAFASA